MLNPNYPDNQINQLEHFVVTGESDFEGPAHGYTDHEEYRGFTISRYFTDTFSIKTPVAWGGPSNGRMVIYSGWLYGQTVDELKARMDTILDTTGHKQYLVRSLEDADILAAIGPGYTVEVFQSNGATRFVKPLPLGTPLVSDSIE